MMEGLADSVVLPLFLFNVGIELGQIQIVLIFFLAYLTIYELIRIRHLHWSRVINVLSILISILLIINIWKG
jgi:ubiquitin-protein ligase